MACYHPLRAFPIGRTASGKVDYKICSTDCQAVWRFRGKDKWFCSGDADLVDKYRYDVVTDYITIPCGQCIGCRLAYSREWANRMLMELPYCDSAYFVTLTYNPQSVPMTSVCDLYSGVALNTMTLCKRDLTLFFKRLRRAFPDDYIRYYACGEYGTDSWRPHYHAIIFGLHLDDLELLKVSRGNPYYTSNKLSSVWSVDGKSLGHVLVANVSWQTCAYVARYCTKKAHGRDKSLYASFGLVPEYSCMSRKPGIGYFFFRDHPDLYDHLYINVCTPDGGRKFKPPRYFDKMYADINPTRYEGIKAVRREMADALNKMILSKTDLDMDDYLQVQEELADIRLNSLIRGDI